MRHVIWHPPCVVLGHPCFYRTVSYRMRPAAPSPLVPITRGAPLPIAILT